MEDKIEVMDTKGALKIMVEALQKVEVAKEDAKEVVESTFDKYEKDNGKISKKTMKKVARAIATSKYQDLNVELQEIQEVIDAVPTWQSLMSGE